MSTYRSQEALEVFQQFSWWQASCPARRPLFSYSKNFGLTGIGRLGPAHLLCLWSSPEQYCSYMPPCGHVSHWTGPWLPWICFFTMDLTHYHYTLGWSWSASPIPDFDLTSDLLNCYGVVWWPRLLAEAGGHHWICPACLAWVLWDQALVGEDNVTALSSCLLPGPSSPSLMEQYHSKGVAWQASLLKSMVVRPHSKHDRQKGLWVGKGYSRALATSTKYSRKNSRSIYPQKSILKCWQLTHASSSAHMSVEN